MTSIGRIGIIGGAGWLGGAFAAALLKSGVVAAGDMSLSYRTSPSDYFPGVRWTRDNQELVRHSDVVILSVRPADWRSIAIDAGGKLVISVMAGVQLHDIVSRCNTDRVVRSLPNAAAEVLSSYTPWIGSAGVDGRDRETIKAIFDTCGTSDEVGSESQIDYMTGMTGSGPAFPAMLASALAEDAVRHGLDRDAAERAALSVIIGAGRLLEKLSEPPAKTVATFLDYRGTTAAGIQAMLDAGFDAAVQAGLKAAYEKSLSMGA